MWRFWLNKKLGVFFLLLGCTAFSFGEDLKEINKKIKNKYIEKGVKVDMSGVGESVDKYYQKEGKLWIDTKKELNETMKKVEKGLSSPTSSDCKKEGEEIGKSVIEKFDADKRMKKWIEGYSQDLYKKYVPEDFVDGSGNNIVGPRERKEAFRVLSGNKDFTLDKSSDVLDSDERIYIFMSSSVPKTTWKSYAKTLREIGSKNIFIVLRGCIGKDGCKYFAPTYNFVKNVLYEGRSSGDVSIPVNVILDPFLFRKYSVRRVPSIVYVKGISLVREGVTEGYSPNLRKEIKDYYLMEGDASLQFFIERMDAEGYSFAGIERLKDFFRGF